jgi:hypothetical protein
VTEALSAKDKRLIVKALRKLANEGGMDSVDR